MNNRGSNGGGHSLERGPLDPEVIDRVLTGEAAEREVNAVRAWLEHEAPDSDVAMSLRNALASSRHEWGLDAAWTRLNDTVRANEGTTGRVAPSRPLWSRLRDRGLAPIMVRAAAALLVVSGGFSLWQARRVSEPVVRYATANAERDSVRLSDGSLVILAPGSELTLQRNFNRNERAVALEGGGFFVVAADRARPFTVEAGDAVSRVLGTEFLVTSYPGSDRVDVVVREGLVSVKGQGTDSVLVAPGFAVRASGGVVGPPAETDVSARISWTNGPLVLVDVPLGEALPEIAHWLDVSFAPLDPTVAAQRVSLRLQPGDREAVEGLALSIGALAEWSGTTVRLRPASP